MSQVHLLSGVSGELPGRFVFYVYCGVFELVLEKFNIFYLHHSYLLLVATTGSNSPLGFTYSLFIQKHTVMRFFREAVMSTSMISKYNFLACSWKFGKVFASIFRMSAPDTTGWNAAIQCSFMLGTLRTVGLYHFIPPTWNFWSCSSSLEKLSHCFFLQSWFSWKFLICRRACRAPSKAHTIANPRWNAFLLFDNSLVHFSMFFENGKLSYVLFHSFLPQIRLVRLRPCIAHFKSFNMGKRCRGRKLVSYTIFFLISSLVESHFLLWKPFLVDSSHFVASVLVAWSFWCTP